MGIPLKVLIVEDSEDDALLLVIALREGCFDPSCRRVETRKDMAEALKTDKWDIIFSDYYMPHFDSSAALEVFKESGVDIPFIIVSGRIGEEIAVQSMKAGAHDYILKNNLARLAPAVERELREAENRRARKQAEEALLDAKMKADFYLDLMTHDLTNYNHNLLGNLTLLERQEKISDGGLPILETCKRQVAKAENLISKVRTFSLVKSVENTMLQPIDVNVMIAESIKTVKMLYPLKTADIVFLPPSDRMALGMDLLDHVIMNVVENAVKYSPDDGGRIDISVESAAEEPEKFWEIRVADNGPGVPDEMKERIFDRFSRIGTEKKGTGLGLSLSKAIMEKFGGGIRVEDCVPGAPGEGSVFVIAVPKG